MDRVEIRALGYVCERRRSSLHGAKIVLSAPENRTAKIVSPAPPRRQLHSSKTASRRFFPCGHILEAWLLVRNSILTYRNRYGEGAKFTS
jgi:hypothetical protein